MVLPVPQSVAFTICGTCKEAAGWLAVKIPSSLTVLNLVWCAELVLPLTGPLLCMVRGLVEIGMHCDLATLVSCTVTPCHQHSHVQLQELVRSSNGSAEEQQCSFLLHMQQQPQSPRALRKLSATACAAYGNPAASDWNLTSPYGAYTFRDLHYVVDYQQSQLIRRGIKGYTTAPQAILAASEQHWDANPPNNSRPNCRTSCCRTTSPVAAVHPLNARAERQAVTCVLHGRSCSCKEVRSAEVLSGVRTFDNTGILQHSSQPSR